MAAERRIQELLEAAVGDRYEVIRHLGGGGMAQVFLAKHRVHEGLHAIKVLNETLAAEPEVVKRFQRESRIAAGLAGQPHIVNVFDIGEKDGLHYLVMQYVEGEDLATRVRRDGRLPVEEAVRIVTEIAEALARAGDRRVVHRDLKPSNVMLDENGRVVVLDFGIAKAVDGHTFRTSTGAIIGTPHYMSPEQIHGESCDPRTDLYALGVIFFELLTGARPFVGDTPVPIWNAHLSKPVPEIQSANPKFDSRLQKIVSRLMAKRREERYPDARELIRDLKAIREEMAPTLVLDRSESVAKDEGLIAEPTKGERRRIPWRWLAAGVAAIGLVFAVNGTVGALATGSMARVPPPPRPKPPRAPDEGWKIPVFAAAVQPAYEDDDDEGAAPVAAKPKTEGPKVGDTRVGKDGLTYVWIPPGVFRMGCSPGDDECGDDEKPARRAVIERGFWMGQTEVTQAAFERVRGKKPSGFKGPKLPVENVSWNDSKAYCEGVGLRLPTAKEWEYAARAGSTGSSYGELERVAWYGENSGRKTHEVATKNANKWGLYDMLGNVWEWTATHYNPRLFVVRGGGWNDSPRDVRVSYSVGGGPAIFNDVIGFRCVGE